MLAVIAPGIAVQFILGLLQFAAFFANACTVMLAAFFTHIPAFFFDLVDIMTQLGAGDTGLGRSGQAQSSDEGKGNQLGIHGYSPDGNGMWRVGLTLATSPKLVGKA